MEFSCPVRLYQQYDADTSLAVPGSAYGGWTDHKVTLSSKHTALVVMHAWHTGLPGEYPGWERAVEYQTRARRILAEIFPEMLEVFRKSPLPVFHVVGGGEYFQHLPGYRSTVELAGPEPETASVAPPEKIWQDLQGIREARGFPGAHNMPDIRVGFSKLDFAPEARPKENEGIAENAHQLAALCRTHSVNHLIYTGFALNWCLLMSPGGMVDMKRRGAICSTIAEATTSVENLETAGAEISQELALWRVSLEFGYVFRLLPILQAVRNLVS